MRQHGDYALKFHSDANWQFEAIEYLLNLSNVTFNIVMYRGLISVHVRNTSKVDSNVLIKRADGNRKEAIFEALYQFSQYLKHRNEKS